MTTHTHPCTPSFLRSTLTAALTCAALFLGPAACDKGDDKQDDDKSENGTKATDEDKEAMAEQRVKKVCEAACSKDQLSCGEPVFDDEQDKCDEGCTEKFEDIFKDLGVDKCADATVALMECAFKQACSDTADIFDAYLDGEYSQGGDCDDEMDRVDEVCGFDLGDIDSSDVALDGSGWTEVFGVAVDDGDNNIKIVMTDDEDVDCDTDIDELENFISFKIPDETGEFIGVSVDFGFSDEIITDSEGTVEIAKIDDDMISGAVVASVSDDNHVVSLFELHYCL